MAGELMQIGAFAQRVGLSVKAIRFYQERGLLEPAWVDPDTGYRYYDAENAEVALRIRTLREVGVPVRELSDALQGALPTVLADRRRELEQQLQEIPQAMAQLARLGPLETPTAVDVPPITGAALSFPSQVERLGVDVPRLFGMLLTHLEVQGIAPEGPAVGLCHHIDATGEFIAGPDVSLQVLMPTRSSSRPPLEDLVVGGGRALVVEHQGHYAGVIAAHRALGEASRRAGVARVGVPIERYLVGPADTSDATQWRTQVVWWVSLEKPRPFTPASGGSD